MGRSQTDGPWQSYVYAIGTADHRHVKIGVSASMQTRLASIQTGCPFTVSILWQADGDAALEDALHGHFAAYRRRGEWFEFPAGQDVIELIGSAADQLASEISVERPKCNAIADRPEELRPPARIHLVMHELELFQVGDRLRVTTWGGYPCLTVFSVDRRDGEIVEIAASDQLSPEGLRLFGRDAFPYLEKVPAGTYVEEVTPVEPPVVDWGAVEHRDVEGSLWCSCGLPVG